MRIHSDHLTTSDVYRAARHARVDVVELTEHKSQSRDHSFNVKLEGESRRRPNGGASGKGYASGYAATWDQWGVFLAILFDIDPAAICGTAKRPIYADRVDYQRNTNGRFGAPPLGTGVSTNYHVVNGRDEYDPAVTVHRLGADYWPNDAHGDHTFRFEGIRFDGAIVHRCTKCSAAQIHIV
jgi:hypothetical protein